MRSVLITCASGGRWKHGRLDMPELFGQPFKDELRAEIRELHADIELRRKSLFEALQDISAYKTLYLREKERRERAEQELANLKKALLELAGGAEQVLTQ